MNPEPLKNNHRYMRRIVDKEIKLILCYDVDTIKSAVEHYKQFIILLQGTLSPRDYNFLLDQLEDSFEDVMKK